MSNLNAKRELSRRNFLGTGAAAAWMANTPGWAMADAYPNKPIRLVIPSAAGGAPDVVIRMISTDLGTALGQPIVVDNKPGGGGLIGMSDLSRAVPDGYTLGYGNVATLSINRHLYAKLPYDPEELTGIALLGSVQNALVVRSSLPVKNVQELIAYARQNPGRLTMGSAGNGTTSHLGGELFKSMTGTFMTHVPYRGSPAAIQDLMGGHVDLMFDNLSSIAPHIQANRVRALGVSGAKRSPMFPTLPTIQEQGVKDYETTAWGGIVGPKGLPDAIVVRLNQEINRLLGEKRIRDRYREIGFDTMASPPSLIMAMARVESPRWANVIQRSGAKIE